MSEGASRVARRSLSVESGGVRKGSIVRAQKLCHSRRRGEHDRSSLRAPSATRSDGGRKVRIALVHWRLRAFLTGGGRRMATRPVAGVTDVTGGVIFGRAAPFVAATARRRARLGGCSLARTNWRACRFGRCCSVGRLAPLRFCWRLLGLPPSLPPSRCALVRRIREQELNIFVRACLFSRESANCYPSFCSVPRQTLHHRNHDINPNIITALLCETLLCSSAIDYVSRQPKVSSLHSPSSPSRSPVRAGTKFNEGELPIEARLPPSRNQR